MICFKFFAKEVEKGDMEMREDPFWGKNVEVVF